MKAKFITLSVIFIIAALFFQNIASAQSVWTTQYLSSIGGNYLRKIQFVNQMIGWACGGNGTLIKTVNGGDNWSVINVGTSQFLTSLYFEDQNTGWVGAQDAFIRKTTNGGTTWYSAPVDIQSGWWAAEFSFVNSLTGYVTSNTRLNKTTDGGLSWNLASSASSGFGPVQFFDEQTGYVMGLGFLGKTINGGVNWTSILNSSNVDEALFFLNAQTGWVLQPGSVRKTTDGCDTWSFVNIPIQHPYAVKFFNENLGWCVGDNNGTGVICRTMNGGANWVVQKTEINNSYYDISFINQNTGWVSGNSIISSTQNGALTSVSQISSALPDKFSLKQNYPNPFNPDTKIKFEMKSSSFASLKVFDMTGREIQQLVNENLTAGSYEVTFNAGNLNSGVYFYVLKTNEFSETKKMMFVK